MVELLIVVAVVALLIAILVPCLARAKGYTLRVLCGSNLRQISLAMGLYLETYAETYPCAQDPVSTNPTYWLWMGRGWRGLIGPVFNTRIGPDNPSVLLCPADPAGKSTYQATSYAYSMAFYHSPEQIDAATAPSDTYTNPKPYAAQRIGDVAKPGRKILVGEWTSNHQPIANDKGWWCWGGARNFLLADGQWQHLEAARINTARDGMPDPNLTAGGVGGADLGP